MKNLKNQLLFIFAVITVFAFAISWIMLGGILKDRIVEEARSEISRQTAALGNFIDANGLESLKVDLDNWRAMIGGRLTVIRRDGKVILDSDVDPSKLDNHFNRPEIQTAFNEGNGTSLRYSRSLNADLLYVAQKSEIDDEPVVVRIAYPMETLKKAFLQARNRLIVYILMLVAVVILLELWVIRRFFRPLENIIKVACQIARGEKGHFPLMKDTELQKLSNALDSMSENLRSTMDDLSMEREMLNSIITIMPTGVILLDKGRKIRFINETAISLLGIQSNVQQGEFIERLIPYHDMYSVMDNADNGLEKYEYLNIPEMGNKYLRVSASPAGTGMLIVLNDLTHEREQEEARKNFIADASHELQTPLTTIRVTAEYLVDILEDNEEAVKYLNTVIKQQERITGLVDDMLLLSRMESQPPSEDKENIDISLLLQASMEEYAKHPFAENIKINDIIEKEVVVNGRISDITRAINNVLDNAVKYVHEKFKDEPGGEITLILESKGDNLSLRISDNGVGISPPSGARIFERFRRGDQHRARGSWGNGGYGLGLAIAKRVFEAHGGSIYLLNGNDGADFEINLPVIQNRSEG